MLLEAKANTNSVAVNEPQNLFRCEFAVKNDVKVEISFLSEFNIANPIRYVVGPLGAWIIEIFESRMSFKHIWMFC